MNPKLHKTCDCIIEKKNYSANHMIGHHDDVMNTCPKWGLNFHLFGHNIPMFLPIDHRLTW